jgi:hypothetical protein
VADRWDPLDAELADTIAAERVKRSPRPQEPASAPPSLPAATCPDCGLEAALRPGQHCEGCGLSWDDLETAADFYDGLLAAASLEAALPSPRAPHIPKDGRNR